MKKIIEEVLQTEERIGRILEEARRKASEIRQAAEKEISDQTSQAKQKAQEIIQTEIEKAKKEAELLRAEKIEQANQEKESLIQNNPETIDKLIDQICDIILTTEYDRENK